MHLELVQRMSNIEIESEIHVSFISFIELHFTKYALSFAVNYSFTHPSKNVLSVDPVFFIGSPLFVIVFTSLFRVLRRRC